MKLYKIFFTKLDIFMKKNFYMYKNIPILEYSTPVTG